MSTFQGDSKWKESPNGHEYRQAKLTNFLRVIPNPNHGDILHFTREDLLVMLAEFPEPEQYGKDTP